jgi:putative FmdB family regulatory protein
MPIYEYRCRACGAAFERLVSGQTAVTCPTCGSADVARNLSLFRPRTGRSVVGAGSGGGCGCGAGGCGCH